MKIIKPSFQIITPIDPEQILKTIEAVGRTCYKSEDKITEDSCRSFVAGIIKRGHEAVIEHYSFIFELNNDSYKHLRYAIERLEYNGFNSFFRFTSTDRRVVSANVRAWRDFFKACLNNDITIPVFTWKFIHENEALFPEFKDIGPDIVSDELFKPLTVSDLQEGVEQLTHTDVTVRLTNDRGVSHEEVRHRVASFAQESTRYCNYFNEKFGSEITYIDIRGGMEIDPKTKNLDAETFMAIYNEWLLACEDAERHYNKMIELGAPPQIARSVLNNSTKTEICITMNLVGWMHFFMLRTPAAAHPQMREIANPLLTEFKEIFPVYFDDIEVTV